MAKTKFEEYAPLGEPLLTSGLERNGDVIDGMGLLTYGLLWPCSGIWIDVYGDPFNPNGFGYSLTTSWVGVSGFPWNDSGSGASLSTTWTEVSNGIWGEC